MVVLAGFRDIALAKPPTDENMSEMTKIKKTFNSRGEVISVFKHTLDYHHHFGIPFIFFMPEPPIARFACLPDGSINVEAVELEKRGSQYTLHPHQAFWLNPLLETIVSGDIQEAEGSDALDIIYEKVLDYDDFKRLKARGSRKAIVGATHEKARDSAQLMSPAVANDVEWEYFRMAQVSDGQPPVSAYRAGVDIFVRSLGMMILVPPSRENMG